MSAVPWITEQARSRADLTALRFGGSRLSWAALADEAVAVAASLSRHGVTRGDTIAVRMTAGPRLVAILHASQMLGAALLPLNTRFSEGELASVVEHVSPRLVLDAGESTSAWWGHRPRVSALDDAAAPKSFTVPSQIDHGATLTIVMTSGSSGAPKAVALTNANHEASAAASRQRLGHGGNDVWLATLPLFHVGGLAILARSALEGSEVVLEPSFDVERAGSVLGGSGGVRPTMVSLVPTMLSRVLDRMLEPPSASLRCVLVGGAMLPPSLGRRALDAGLPVSATYGMTEACSQIATSVPGSEDAAQGLVGSPLTGVEIRIDGADADGWGEILVRGPCVARGYLRNPEANAAFRNGWLRTGDLGRLDANGTLAVHGRRSDLIVTGGENVSPVEVERVLDDHPSVAESLVIGIDDDEWGQRVVALVVPANDSAPASEPLQAWCRQRLASYKVPRELRFVRELPRGATGKTLRPRR